MTSDIKLNRLNFANVVGRQFGGVSVPNETYFSPHVITGKRKVLEFKPSTRTEMSTSFNSIVTSVHNKLRNQKFRKLEQAKIPEEQPKEVNDDVAEASPQNLSEIKSEMVDTNAESKINFPKPNSPLKATSIPKIKAMRAHKQQQRMRHNILKITDYNDPVSQKRILEIKAQKRILEDMLMHNQRLQRDQHTIATEVQAMREHVRDLSNKLDISLRRLTARPVASSQAFLRPKVSLRPQKFNPTPFRKSHSPPNTPITPQSILKTSTKSIHQAAQKADSPARNKQRPMRNTASPTRNTLTKR